MNFWNCSNCEAKLSDNGQKELGLNDTYILLYTCNKCSAHGYTVTKNTKNIVGATIVKVLDKEIHTQSSIDEEIKKHMS